MLTSFCLFFDHLPSSVGIFYLINVDKKSQHCWTTYLPLLVNVVCEGPLVSRRGGRGVRRGLTQNIHPSKKYVNNLNISTCNKKDDKGREGIKNHRFLDYIVYGWPPNTTATTTLFQFI